MIDWQQTQQLLLSGDRLADSQARLLAACDDTDALASVAAILRDRGHNNFSDLLTQGLYSADAAVSRCLSLLHFCSNSEETQASVYVG